jgi:predicted phage replisome organizer
MADIKWIKVAVDMFEDSKIEFIRSLPEGDAIIVTWIQMLSIAGQSNMGGYLMVAEGIPYTEQLLSNKLRRQPVLLQFALETLTKLKMIDIEDGPFHITKWEKHQNVEGMEKVRLQTRKRVEKHRETKRIEILGGDPCQYCGGKATGLDHVLATARGGKDIDENKVPCCIDCNRMKNDKPLVEFLNWNREIIKDEIVCSNTVLMSHVTLCSVTNRYKVTQCNATELELDLELEKEKEKELITSSSINPFKLFESEGFGTISSVIAEKLGMFIDDYGERWVIEAMKVAVLQSKRTLSYVDGILKRWKAEGIDSPWEKERGVNDAKHEGFPQGVRSGSTQTKGISYEGESRVSKSRWDDTVIPMPEVQGRGRDAS